MAAAGLRAMVGVKRVIDYAVKVRAARQGREPLERLGPKRGSASPEVPPSSNPHVNTTLSLWRSHVHIVTCV